MAKTDYDRAMRDAEEEMSNEEIQFFRSVIAIFTNQLKAEIDLIGFSQLPDNFQLKEFIDIIMQTYALAFGYPVSEVWTVSTGSFSRDGEIEAQQGQATAKGELAFSLSLQDQLQTHFIPSSVLFSFDLRNDLGDLSRAEIDNLRTQTIINLYTAGRISGESDEPLLSRDQALELLASYELIPNAWIEELSDSGTQDIKEIREHIRRNPFVINRALLYPDEPIVYYRYDALGGNFGGAFVDVDTNDYLLSRTLAGVKPCSGTYGVLFSSGEDMLRKKIF
jgi:hypothetical protein